MLKKNLQKGSIRWFIMTILAIIIASYFFDFSVQEAVEDEQTQSNFLYIKTQFMNFYDAYLRQPLDYFWNTIVVDLLWSTFIENLENIKSGEPTNFEQAASGLEIHYQ